APLSIVWRSCVHEIIRCCTKTFVTRFVALVSSGLLVPCLLIDAGVDDTSFLSAAAFAVSIIQMWHYVHWCDACKYAAR
ncbi:MAG: hypothetical protein ACTJLL_03335, partial [Anaplasma sp.]